MSLATQSSVLGPQVGGASSAVYALASSPSLRGIDESGWLPAIVIPVIYREGQAPRYGAEGPGSLIAIIESYLSVSPRASARPGGAAKLGIASWRHGLLSPPWTQ